MKKEEASRSKLNKKGDFFTDPPLDSHIFNSLNNFEENVKFEVDGLMGRLSRQSIKLSCLEGGLRSKNKVEELSREQFDQEMK